MRAHCLSLLLLWRVAHAARRRSFAWERLRHAELAERRRLEALIGADFSRSACASARDTPHRAGAPKLATKAHARCDVKPIAGAAVARRRRTCTNRHLIVGGGSEAAEPAQVDFSGRMATFIAENAAECSCRLDP